VCEQEAQLLWLR